MTAPLALIHLMAHQRQPGVTRRRLGQQLGCGRFAAIIDHHTGQHLTLNALIQVC